ncbi:hypothetical protein BCR44DRAFT_89473 [Catenaria anguillulae PL171]|uniref:DRBM domain-containing protein n=1 Tax=Catenaria anguillulae PL171 TaxID=765915 RepID=A0A1Y2HUF9_9FUNG|nr:hypothetical protein BCR44DRAFT_89473 [Catenaria anguillulae PL171]
MASSQVNESVSSPLASPATLAQSPIPTHWPPVRVARDPFTPPRKIPAVPSSISCPTTKHQDADSHPVPQLPPTCSGSGSTDNNTAQSPHSPPMSPLSRPLSSLRNALPAVTTAAIPSPRAVLLPDSTHTDQPLSSPPAKVPAMQPQQSYRHPASSLDSFMSTIDSPGDNRAHAQAQGEGQAIAQVHMKHNQHLQQPMSAPFAAPPGHRAAVPPIRSEVFGSTSPQARPNQDPDYRLVAFPSPGLVPRAPKLPLHLSQSSRDPSSSRPTFDTSTQFPKPPPTRPSDPYPGIPSNPPTPTQKPMASTTTTTTTTPPHPAANHQDDLNETQLLLAQHADPLLPQVPADAPHYTQCLAYERTLAHAAANNRPNDKLSLNPISAVMTILSKRKVPVTEIVWEAPERSYGAAVGKRFACVVHVLGKTYATRAKYLNKERAKRDAAWLVLMALWCTSVDQWRECTHWVTGMDLVKAAESGKMMSLADYYRAVTRDNPLAKVPGRAGVPIVSDEIETLSATHAQYLMGGNGTSTGSESSRGADNVGGGSSPMACPPTAPMTPAVLSRKTPKARVLELGSKIGTLNPVWGGWSRASNGEWQIELMLGASGVSAIGSGSKRKEAEDAAALACLRGVLEHPQWGPKLKADPAVMGKCFAGLEASASMSVGDGTAELAHVQHRSPSAPTPTDPFRQQQQPQHVFPLHDPLPAVPTSSHLGAVDSRSWYNDDSSDLPIPTPLPDDLEFKHDPAAAMTPLLLGQPGIGQPNIWSTTSSSLSSNNHVNPNPIYGRDQQQPDSIFPNPSAPALHHALPAVPHTSAFSHARDTVFGSTSPSVSPFLHAAHSSPSSSATSAAADLAHSAWTARMELEDKCAKFGFPITFTISPAVPTPSMYSPHSSPSTAAAGIQAPRELTSHNVQWTVRVHVQLAPPAVALDFAHSGANRLAVMESVAREAAERIEVWYGATQIAMNP